MALNAEDGGNRKCISVQLPELTDEKSEAFKAKYKTIADIAKERIRRAAKKIQSENPDYQGDLGFKVLKLADSNFKQWQVVNNNIDELSSQIELFVDPTSETASVENMVYELLLKNGKDLNAKIEHKDNYHLINQNELVLMLEQANQNIVDAVLTDKPLKVIALDKLFNGNDQLKTNTVLQFKDAGIEFRTI
jgi:adenine-specific DNA-methyltransferase